MAHSESCQRISAVDIVRMRSELLERLDQYDAIALELGRMHIPLKTSWTQWPAVAMARLKEMVELHDRARAAQLSLELGETTFSEAQIRRLDAEVKSMADCLSCEMTALSTSISAMQSAAASAAPARVSDSLRDSGDTPVRPGIPAALLHPGSAHSAESAKSAPDSAAPADPQTEREGARRRRMGPLCRQTEMIANEKLRTEVNEWIGGECCCSWAQ